MTFDWSAEPSRPLSREGVWLMMVNGCNLAEIMAAGKICAAAARGLMADAASHYGKRETLKRSP